MPFFVEIDRSNWLSDKHIDISEIVLSDMNVSDEFGTYVLDEDFSGILDIY